MSTVLGLLSVGGGAQKSGIATSQTLVDHFTKPGGWDYSRLVWLPNEVCVSQLHRLHA